VIFNASVNDRNIFGSGISLGFELDTSKRTRRNELSLNNPRVNDSVYSLGFSLYQTHYESDDYTRDSEGVSVTAGRRFDRHWRGSLRAGWSRNENYYDDEDNHPERHSGETVKINLTPYLRYNSTDDFFIPREGINFTQSLEYAGMGGDEHYTKSVTELGAFKGLEPLIDYDLILRYRARLQLADADITDPEAYPLGSRLYLGGTRSLRGFRSGTVSPLMYDDAGNVLTDSEGDAYYRGGTRAFNQSLEMSLPLIADAQMRMALFYDYGAIGVDNFDVTRSSYGFALEWFSPMGPLQFVWAWPIDEKPHDRTSTFEFTLGQQF
jgi:outer membrane protein insertion porin family